MAGGTNEPGRSVASRMLGILDAFDSRNQRLSLSEIARRSGLPLATAHRLIAELVDWRGLERGEDGSYRIGLRLWEVGQLGSLHTRLRAVAMPYLQALYESTLENVHLAVLDESDVLLVERLSGHRSVPIFTRSGQRMAAHASGVGQALLAYEPEEVLRELFSRPLERITPYTQVEPGRLRRTLALVRERGYAVTREEIKLGRASIAAPVFHRDGRPVAAVGVVVPSARADPAKLASPVRLAAEGIADRLQRPGEEPRVGPAEAVSRR